MITKFLNQSTDLEAFITGPAGSGKTTYLKDVITQLNKDNITYKVVAYTHKAKDVLISKLPKNTDVTTLHSWLKKRPGINSKAKHMRALMTTSQHGKPEMLELLIVDEFSFVGEKDYYSIGELQDDLSLNTDENGDRNLEYIKPLKVLYVGDLNQLSPVDGPPAVFPIEPYWTKLTTIHRSTSDISKPLAKLVDMIEGNRPMKFLEPTNSFLRKQNIDTLYKQDETDDKIMLAFTNRAVQLHNQKIQGYKVPQQDDIMYCPSLKKIVTLNHISNSCQDLCVTPIGQIGPDTKYNPLKILNKLDYVKFYYTDIGIIPGIFGSYENKIIRDKLGKLLVSKNKRSVDSKEVFKEYKSINDYVSILDFNHCMTIHKSQGSEYTNVYVDSEDLSICFDKQERMKLLYVAMSRSKDKIFLNN